MEDLVYVKTHRRGGARTRLVLRGPPAQQAAAAARRLLASIHNRL